MAATMRMGMTTAMFAVGLQRVDEPLSKIQGHSSDIFTCQSHDKRKRCGPDKTNPQTSAFWAS